MILSIIVSLTSFGVRCTPRNARVAARESALDLFSDFFSSFVVILGSYDRRTVCTAGSAASVISCARTSNCRSSLVLGWGLFGGPGFSSTHPLSRRLAWQRAARIMNRSDMLPCFHESFHFAQSGKWYGGSGSGIKSISFHSDVVLSLEQLNLPIELLYCSRDIPMMDVLLLDLGLEGGDGQVPTWICECEG